MIHLFLARHGNTFEKDQTPVQIGSTDLPLTTQGKMQALKLASYFKAIDPVAIFSGKLKRQMETAKIIARDRNLNFGFLPSESGEICDEFGQLSSKRIVEGAILEEKDKQIRAKVSDSERIKPKVEVRNVLFEPALSEIDYGSWEGLTTEQISAKWPKEYENWTKKSKWPENVFKGSLENHLLKILKWLDFLQKAYSSGDNIVGVSSNGIIKLFYSLASKDWETLSDSSQMEKIKVSTGNFCELLLYPDCIKIISWNTNP